MLLKIDLVKSPWFLLFTVAFYIIVAYYSTGYHNYDEHYQIIEFANYKLGKAAPYELAWEFAAKVRPGLQPGICYLVFKALSIVGVKDVYYSAFALRLISATLSILVSWLFIKSSRSIVESKYHNSFIILSYVLWFLPYISVRFSSENWSGMFILASLALIQFNDYQNSIKRLLLLGFLIGISILFRYQSAFIALGIILWLLLIAKLQMKKVAVVAVTILLILVAGFFIDRWLYGEYTVTLYNYFYVNIVENVASRYGTSPWYQIIFYIIKSPGPIGVVIFSAFVTLIFIKPKSLLIWSTIPFLLIHSVIPHKELRFLFPIANLTPIVLILAYQHINKLSVLKNRSLKYIALVILFVINTAGLISISSKGAGLGRISVGQYINRHYPVTKLNVMYAGDINPYCDWNYPKNTFYTNTAIKLTPITTVWKKEQMDKRLEGYTNLLVISNNDITGPLTLALFKRLKMVRVYQSIPDIVENIDRFYNFSNENDGLNVYEFKD